MINLLEGMKKSLAIYLTAFSCVQDHKLHQVNQVHNHLTNDTKWHKHKHF